MDVNYDDLVEEVLRNEELDKVLTTMRRIYTVEVLKFLNKLFTEETFEFSDFIENPHLFNRYYDLVSKMNEFDSLDEYVKSDACEEAMVLISGETTRISSIVSREALKRILDFESNLSDYEGVRNGR